MPHQSTSIEDRMTVGQELLDAINTHSSVIIIDQIEVPLDDIDEDFQTFIEQSGFYIRYGFLWPSIALDQIDFQNAPRFAPMDAPAVTDASPSTASSILRDTVEAARAEGLPVHTLSIEQARYGFMQGAIDAIFGRARWRLFSSTDPLVKVRTSPDTNVRVMYSKGRFWKTTANVFGDTDCEQNLRAGPYCFWRRNRKPSYSMPVYNVTVDRTIINP